MLDLLIIDPQESFCDKKTDELYVNGAEEASSILAEFIRKFAYTLNNIRVTLDSHQEVDISHCLWWRNKINQVVQPFTIIKHEDIINGNFTTYHPGCLEGSIRYVKKLEENSRYLLCTWPDHCIIGTPGHNIVKPIRDALHFWKKRWFRQIDYVTKGSNPWTEHYSAIIADVTDYDIVGDDPSVQLNVSLLERLKKADNILVAGWASSHCVKFTVEDIISNFGEEHIKKLILLQDCMNPVRGFEMAEKELFDKVLQCGGTVIKSSDFGK